MLQQDCMQATADKKKKKTAAVTQQELKKEKVRGEGSATFHFVHCDMMKYLITDSVEPGFRHIERNVEGRQKCMKWNRRGSKDESGVRGGRDTGRHEQASKCQGEMNSWRRNLLWEVCVCLASARVCASTCICIPPHIYLPVYNKHALGPERISFAKISICQFN